MIRLSKDIEGQELLSMYARKGEYIETYNYGNGSTVAVYKHIAILNNELIYSHRDKQMAFTHAREGTKVRDSQTSLDTFLMNNIKKEVI